MVRGAKAQSSLAVAALVLAAFGLIAAGVQLGQGALSGDRHGTSDTWSRPARVIVPAGATTPLPVLPAFIPSSSTSATGNTPELAPGPQSAPAPDRSNTPVAPPAPSPTPVPTPELPGLPPLLEPETDVPPVEEIVDPVLPPETEPLTDPLLDPIGDALDPVVDSLVNPLLGTVADTTETGSEPVSGVTIPSLGL